MRKKQNSVKKCFPRTKNWLCTASFQWTSHLFVSLLLPVHCSEKEIVIVRKVRWCTVSSYPGLSSLFNSLLSLFSSVKSGSRALHLNCLPAVHSCQPKTWVPRQPSTRKSSYPMMRRCLLPCRWSGGPRRRSPSWPLVVRETTWPSSASQVRAQIKFSSLPCV